MNLVSMLRRLGDRLGIVELSSESEPSAPVKIQTRTITLTELIMTIRTTEVRSLAEATPEWSVSFDDVFQAAGIHPPPTGWTVDRLGEFLNSDRVRGLEREAAQREILSMLETDKTDPADIVKDAISRDQALDAYARSVLERRQRWLAGKKQAIREIEQEIADEEKKWNEWRAKKRQREQDMARSVGYLIDKPVISIDDE
jgi:hypothetical protein